ncbi:MAG: DUF4351 domain-containing protein [Leptolyngbyaceae cyanobacterium SM2_5_2]|nr:DUF4351 domain-containing protein [Leptolyngbyaceae cyanobacterium SM2_5_2]
MAAPNQAITPIATDVGFVAVGRHPGFLRPAGLDIFLQEISEALLDFTSLSDLEAWLANQE